MQWTNGGMRSSDIPILQRDVLRQRVLRTIGIALQKNLLFREASAAPGTDVPGYLGNAKNRINVRRSEPSEVLLPSVF